jgi:SagB-type dehydrogenase family enzyme
MQHEQQPAILASPPAGGDAARLTSQSFEKILAYHERSKHRLERYAAGPEALDWDAQPNPFREFAGSPRIKLPLIADTLTASFDDLHAPNAIPPQPFTLDHISALLELAFGLSAWKQYGPDRWGVRCNPSSGNLHPTEAYVICHQITGLEDGVYHYLSRDHLLEQRGKFAASNGPQPSLRVGLSSIFWREAWKYGERAFRYCQLDTGHAIGALRYAAATLGWSLKIRIDCGHQQLEQYLGLDRDSDFNGAEREEPELLIEISTSQTALTPAHPDCSPEHWYGQANILDAHPMYRWPVIDEVALASRNSSATSATIKVCENYPALNRDIPHRNISAATLIRQRRSAQRFNARRVQEADSFYRMLDALLPRLTAPMDAWQEAARVHPVLFVHRVAGLTPGIYALPRSPAAQMQMQTAMRSDFIWRKPADCPAHFPLFLLAEADLSKAAKIMNCHQAIAGDSTFMLALLAEFDAPLKNTPWRYRELYWEAGLLGQVLYLQAEAAGLRGTGIGCFFDDTLHELLGLQDRTFQSLYHFTVGYPLTDERIASLPPYPFMPANL